jgi:hypothetical protein
VPRCPDCAPLILPFRTAVVRLAARFVPDMPSVASLKAVLQRSAGWHLSRRVPCSVYACRCVFLATSQNARRPCMGCLLGVAVSAHADNETAGLILPRSASEHHPQPRCCCRRLLCRCVQGEDTGGLDHGGVEPEASFRLNDLVNDLVKR